MEHDFRVVWAVEFLYVELYNNLDYQGRAERKKFNHYSCGTMCGYKRVSVNGKSDHAAWLKCLDDIHTPNSVTTSCVIHVLEEGYNELI